jgi:hypothetical protein
MVHVGLFGAKTFKGQAFRRTRERPRGAEPPNRLDDPKLDQDTTAVGERCHEQDPAEGGDVSTQDVLNRIVTALGGALKLTQTSATSSSKSPDPGEGGRRCHRGAPKAAGH